MNELELPFETEVIQMHIQSNAREFYTLRVCKECRADWLHQIKHWFECIPDREPPCGSGIYIRDFGSIKEITEEEFRLRETCKEACSR
jgi:hypothetical protein